ncbi:MAG TPA: hypothetical protein VMV40_09490 [Acidiferrobacter sp.]|nr:hypothetical protein [Acidiferrobacter sp.]
MTTASEVDEAARAKGRAAVGDREPSPVRLGCATISRRCLL